MARLPYAPGGKTLKGLLRPFGEGHGYTERIIVANPAAGLSATYTVPGDKQHRVLAANARLVTSATVASRQLTVDYQDNDGNLLVSNGGATLQAASLTNDYRFSADRAVSEWTTGSPLFGPLTQIFLNEGWKVVFRVSTIQAADQLSALILVVESFPTGPQGYPQGVS